jgi:secondary thiamine-phosphate synthase enzyme
MTRFEISTHEQAELIDITKRVQDAVTAAKVAEGIVTVFIPHTTAGVTINENADPDVVSDILETLAHLIPRAPQAPYRHAEGNSDSHVKASLMGSSVQVIVESGKLALGTWQGIYFCEFDGPRRREVWVEGVNR